MCDTESEDLCVLQKGFCRVRETCYPDGHILTYKNGWSSCQVCNVSQSVTEISLARNGTWCNDVVDSNGVDSCLMNEDGTSSQCVVHSSDPSFGNFHHNNTCSETADCCLNSYGLYFQSLGRHQPSAFDSFYVVGLIIVVVAIRSLWLQHSQFNFKEGKQDLWYASKSISCKDNGYIMSLSVTGDNSRIVTGHFDNNAVVWDGKTGQVLGTLRGHPDKVQSVSISLNGSVIASCSLNIVSLWDGFSYQKLSDLQSHTDTVSTVSLSSDGAFVLSGSDDKTVIIWDAHTYRRVSVVDHDDFVKTVEISLDGSIFVAGCKDQNAYIWDFKSQKKLHTLVGHTDTVLTVCISRDSSVVVTGSRDKSAIIWNVSTGENIGILKGHFGAVKALSISRDISVILSASADGTAIVWDATSKMNLQTLSAHSSYLEGTALYADASRIITGGSDNKLLFWDRIPRERKYTLPSLENKKVVKISSSLDSSVLVTCYNDYTAAVWDGLKYEIIHNLHGHTREIKDVDVSSDGSIIVTGSDDKTAIVWDGRSGKDLNRLGANLHSSAVSSVCISADASMVVTCSDKIGFVWERVSCSLLYVLDRHTEKITVMNICLQGDAFVVTGSLDKTAIIWDIKAGKKGKGKSKTRHVLAKHKHYVVSMSTKFDGSCVVTGSCDHNAIVWDTKTGDPLQVLSHHNHVKTVMFSRNGSKIITSCREEAAVVWDWESRSIEKKILDRKRLFGFLPGSIDSCCSVLSDILLLIGGTVHIVDFNSNEDDAFSPCWDCEYSNDAILKQIDALKLVPCVSSMNSEAKITVNITNYVENVPEDSIKTKGSHTFEGFGTWIHKATRTPVASYVVPIKNIVGYNSNFLDTVIRHSESIEHYNIFENQVVNAVIQFKWKIICKRAKVIFAGNGEKDFLKCQQENWHELSIQTIN